MFMIKDITYFRVSTKHPQVYIHHKSIVSISNIIDGQGTPSVYIES